MKIRDIIKRRRTYKMTTRYSPYGGAREDCVPAPLDEATLVSSKVSGTIHNPVLDIDFEAALIPSSTKGHFHLYLQKQMTWREYKKLLKALMKAGIIEKDYYRMSIKRGATFVRLPSVSKSDPLGDEVVADQAEPKSVLQALKAAIIERRETKEDGRKKY